MSSILDKARREAVRDYAGQLGQVTADELQDAYNRGRLQGAQDANTGRWWRFGVLCGIALSVLVWRFWP